MRPNRLTSAAVGLATLAAAVIGPAEVVHAQLGFGRRPPGTPAAAPISRNEPVAFTADEVQYDRENGLITATGHVEAWQNDHVLRAEKITFDRNTNIAVATGNVSIVEPDGQVLFSDYAELTEGMRDGVLRGMRALLAENGKLVANGARRTEGQINELSRVVYTTCNLCKKDPTRPPFWDLRARSAVQDTGAKRIEYRDAVLDIYGIPVLWFPYIWHVDPSVHRASGFLVPDFGESKHLGAFFSLPYYWVLDDNSDATITPVLSSRQYFNLNTQYRRRFNDGTLALEVGLGYDRNTLGADVFAKGRFSLNETWRYGFDVARASSSTYLNDYRLSNRGDVLTSNLYLEGFGTGAYTRLNVTAYQGLVASINQSKLPYVLPRYEYSYFGAVDGLGGRTTFDTQDFNVLRKVGTNTQRLGGTLQWQRPFAGVLGERYNLTIRADAAGYVASDLDQNPNFYTKPSAEAVRAQPNVAFDMRWPFVRQGWGTQTIEPIVQLVAGPNVGRLRSQKIPNEDSLDFEFTDQNLFAINKFPGIDRQEGGLRANVGLHFNWAVNGIVLDSLVGQSYRSRKDDSFPIGSGLDHRASDVVTRTTLSPTPWLDLTARTRLDRRDLSLRFADAVGSVGPSYLKLNVGYLYSETNPYFYYDQATIPASYFQHRNEVSVGVNATYEQWRLSATARRDVALGKLTGIALHAIYENECFIFDANVSRRYTSLNGDSGATLVLFQITIKSVGQFGFHAF